MDIQAITNVANRIRKESPCGDDVTYVINRNINFTNTCIKKCGFCSFSRTGIDDEAYFIPLQEIIRRAIEATEIYNASELCIQAGLIPNMDAKLYETITKEIKAVLPSVHLHAFSPEEIKYGAQRNKVSFYDMIARLRDVGLNSIPGTSAEILNDELRSIISKGRIGTQEWIDIISSSHKLGLPTTSTMMYGHIETPSHIANHMATIRSIQQNALEYNYPARITEFVPLSFVSAEAPMYKSGVIKSMRKRPSEAEVILAHAVARIMLAGYIDNIQVSWVKLGWDMTSKLLDCGVNDVGGTLMNESISTAAGSTHGQLVTPRFLKSFIYKANRKPVERFTNYSIRRRHEIEDSYSMDILDPLDQASPETFRSSSFHEMIKDKTNNRFKEYHHNMITKRSIHTRRYDDVKTENSKKIVTYSPSYTIVPTYECFNVCSYCNFRVNVHRDNSLMTSLDQVKVILSDLSHQKKVKEILVLSGEIHPNHERRAEWFQRIIDICNLALDYGFLPHSNVGSLSRLEMKDLAKVNVSMGLMMEILKPLAVHRFATNKNPLQRMEQLQQASELGIPFTTGILCGIGETHDDRISTLEYIAKVAYEYRNIQEVIIQPYSIGNRDKLAKQTDKYFKPEEHKFHLSQLPSLIEEARSLLPSNVVIQIPPNLIWKEGNLDLLISCLDRGASDLGG